MTEYTPKQEQLAQYAKALSNPARIAIMQFWQNVLNVILAI